MSSIVETLGLGGTTLGNMLGGAIQYAGVGALGGAATAAITGGDIGRGATTGALAGAGLGALSGATSGGIASQATGRPSPSGMVDTAAVTEAGGMPGAPSVTQAVLATPTTPPTDGTGASFGERLFQEGGWLERNAGWVGPTLGGIGEGHAEGMASEDEIEADERNANGDAPAHAALDLGSR